MQGSILAANTCMSAYLAAKIPKVSANPTQAMRNSRLARISFLSSTSPPSICSSSSRPMRRKTFTYANPPQRPSIAMRQRQAPIAYVPKIDVKMEWVLSRMASRRTKACATDGRGIKRGGSAGTLKMTLLEREKKTKVWQNERQRVQPPKRLVRGPNLVDQLPERVVCDER